MCKRKWLLLATASDDHKFDDTITIYLKQKIIQLIMQIIKLKHAYELQTEEIFLPIINWKLFFVKYTCSGLELSSYDVIEKENN